jgi:hypothetical protein
MDSNPHVDRRAEQRSPKSGAIRISFEDPNLIVIEAQLIEVSEKGFRASHDSRLLVPGLKVRYQDGDSIGQARAIWTQVSEGRYVSGFLILPSSE